ncbi:MAG: acetoin utilization protein AcuB [Kosmotogales bacterium]|nr:acetoin utilization protein AcuB [Kosmotogales bacterium]
MTIEKWLNKFYPVFNKDDKVSSILEEKKMLPLKTILIKDDSNKLYGTLNIETLKENDKNKIISEVADDVLYYCYEDDYIEDAALLMIESHDFTLPVINRKGEISGVITVFEILEALMEFTSMDQPGLKVSLLLKNEPGSLRKVVDAFADIEINILSIMTSSVKDNEKRVVIRTEERDISEVRNILDEININYESITKEEGFSA